MNKIKVIDLLNMISKGEEVPKKIKFGYQEYEYNDLAKTYYCGMNTLLDNYKFIILNDEVEIIEDTLEEEKKIPKKLNKDRYLGTDLSVEDDMFDKINEILDYLKSKGDK